MKLKPFHPLSQGLIASFLFNEGGGNNVYDATGRGNNGTGTNIAWGRDGLDLPGSNEHITIPNFIAQDDDWTFFISFTQDTRNPSGQSSNSHLLSMQGTGGEDILYIFDKPGTPTYKLATYITGTGRHDSNTVIDIGTSYTVGLTQEGTSFHFYLNGADDGSFVGTAQSESGNIILFDRLSAAGDGCFDGTTGVVHFFDRPLTAEEMMWLDYDPYGMFEPDHIIRGYYESTGTTIPIIIHHLQQQGIL